MREIQIDERPACPRCGEPMTTGFALVCGPSGGRLPLPATCTSRECQTSRDAEAIERAIAAGVIDP